MVVSRLFLVGLGAAGLLVALAGCQKPEAVRPRVLPVATAAVSPARFSDGVDTVSTLESDKLVQLAAQAGGRILRLNVRQGDRVSAGQQLLVLDQVQVEASVASLRAQLEKDKLNYARFEFLAREGAASALQRDELRAAYLSSRQAVISREADLAFRDLRAPIAGVISDLKVKAGDVIATGQELTKVVSNAELMARVDVPAALSSRVRPGQLVVIKDPLTGRTLANGRVDSIDPTVNAGSQSLLVKAAFANPDGVLRNGLRVRTRLVLAEQEQLSVPFEAVIQTSGQSFVFSPGSLAELEATKPPAPVLEAARRLPPGTMFALQVPVSLGPVQNNRFPVQRGLQPGQQVVTSNLLNLRHGVPVAAN
ncbi:efflux RND transporter periplasmic adaptor subunit [Cyanobium sp. Morenito 9A2]|nr:efflux RND transporter periplasmic adaptor subunit [Cyanobium sp. Morenito 9A2]